MTIRGVLELWREVWQASLDELEKRLRPLSDERESELLVLIYEDQSAPNDLKAWRANLCCLEMGDRADIRDIARCPVTARLPSYPKIARFPATERSTDLSTFFICPIHQNIPLSRHRRCAIIRVRWSRHIEKVIWGQNRTDLHKILLTDLWSFLTDLLEISDQPDCNSGSHWKLHSDAWDERKHIWFYPASNRAGDIVSPPWTIISGTQGCFWIWQPSPTKGKAKWT